MDESGEILKHYVLNVGDYEKLKVWFDKFGEIEELSKKSAEGAEIIDQLLDLEKEIVSMVLNDWTWIYEAFEHNVFAIMDLVKELSDLVALEMRDFYSKYE